MQLRRNRCHFRSTYGSVPPRNSPNYSYGLGSRREHRHLPHKHHGWGQNPTIDFLMKLCNAWVFNRWRDSQKRYSALGVLRRRRRFGCVHHQPTFKQRCPNAIPRRHDHRHLETSLHASVRRRYDSSTYSYSHRHHHSVVTKEKALLLDLFKDYRLASADVCCGETDQQSFHIMR